LVLKWDQGVASRGKLSGRRLPLPPKKEPVTPEPGIKSQRKAGKHHRNVSATSFQGNCAADLLAGDLCATAQHEESESSFVYRDAALVDHQLVALAQYPPKLALRAFSSPLLESRRVRYLLHHYNNVVAANMTWADSPENGWRDIIIPMALQFPLVLNSILAFAAKHISAMSSSPPTDTLSRIAAGYSEVYGNQALRLLVQELQPLAAATPGDLSHYLADGHTIEWYNSLLAAILVLCNVETVRPGE
jgi:hypothetical protein